MYFGPATSAGRVVGILAGSGRMRCLTCGSAGVAERLERTAQGYRRFRCRACGKQFNERSGGQLNRIHPPTATLPVRTGL